MPARLTAAAVARRKNQAEPFPVLTAYDAPTAMQVEAAGIDVILVGDSLGNVVLGYDSTAQVTLTDMIRHGGAAVRGTKTAHIIVDLPFGTYQASDQDAVRSACALVQGTGASSVKLEGGVAMAARIRAIAAGGIPVVAHIGVLPQTAGLSSGFKARRDGDILLADAFAVEEAGAFAVVLEGVAHELAAQITRQLAIPTIGIGAGPACDAQVLVIADVIGTYAKPPGFAKRYADVATVVREAAAGFAHDVRAGTFPPKAR